jgi:multidrug transporter EmrE-like cation transporter
MTGGGGSAPLPSSITFSPGTILLNRYGLIMLGALLTTAGEVLLKKGATSVGPTGTLVLAPLFSIWTWLGILCYVTSLVSWLYVLQKIPLSIAFPLINIVHVLVPMGASLFLHEHVSLKRWAGISLIILGVIAIIKPVVHAEEKL